MKCPECDIPLKGDELVCPNCLARLPARPSDEGPESLPAYTVSPDQPKPGIDVFLRRVPWRRLLLIGSLIAALFVAYMMWETFFHVRPEDYLDRGDDLYDQGHFESALAAYQRASEADPDMAAAYERAGWCYYQLQFDDAAVAQFRQAIAQEPDFAEAHLGLGQSLYYQRRYEEAEEALRRAIELAPGQAAGHAYLGSVYFLQQRYSDAIPPLQEAVALDPTDGDSLEFLGRAYYELGQTESALGPLSRAQKLKPRDTEVLEDLTLTFMKREDYARAAETAWQLLAAEPYNPRYHLYLGQSLYYQGNLSEAEGQFHEALLWMQATGVEATAYHYLGLAAYQAGRYQDAIQALKSAVLLDSDNPESYAHLGWSYVYLERCADARPAFETALALNPDLALAQEGLEACP